MSELIPRLRVLYSANSFHLTKTGSTNFLMELMAQVFELTVIPHKELFSLAKGKNFDLLVNFQAWHPPKKLLATGIPRIIHVPMFDDGPPSPDYWKAYMEAGISILCFSKAVEMLSNRAGARSLCVQYWPEVPQGSHEFSPQNAYHGFFWQRVSSLNWPLIRALIPNGLLKSIHVHQGPSEPPLEDLPGPDDNARWVLTRTSWFEQPADYLKAVDRADVYFAPRPAEGIGMSFLEALARGCCVVAPDAPTMNEYIVHGEDGLLYDPLAPAMLDCDDIVRCGHNARKKAIRGRAAWVSQISSVQDFMAKTPQHGKSAPFVRIRCLVEWHLRRMWRWLKELRTS